MKKTIAILTALVLAVLCFPAAQAETGDVIRFQDIPWGSDVETVTQALLDAGWINEDGVKRMGDIEEHAGRTRMGRYMGGSRIPQFVTEDGHIVADADDGSRNAVSGHLMSDMVAQEWMGIEVHNIELIFALEGSTEKLLTVTVSLMVNREDRLPELEEIYGKPDDVNDEDGGSAYWEGQEGSVLYYDGSVVIYSLKDAKELADAAVMDVIETPTPVPTPEPTPEPTPVPDTGEADVLSLVKKGELDFLDIPWDTDEAAAFDRMAALGFITEETLDGLQEKKIDYAYAGKLEYGSFSTYLVTSDLWEAYFFSAGECEFPMTCCGYPVTSATVSFKKDGDNMALKTVTLQCADIGDSESVIWAAKTRLEETLGEGTEWYGSWHWEGENDSVIKISGVNDFIFVDFGINTDGK